jgi:hypothetical protein
MYQPENTAVRFFKFFIFAFPFLAIWGTLFHMPNTWGISLFLGTVIAATSTYTNRPGTLYARFADRQRMLTAIKLELLKNYALADQSEQYLFFRPSSFLSFLGEPIVVEFSGTNAVTIKGAERSVRNLEKKLRESGAIQ